MDPHRLDGHVGGDVRIAVVVAADPRAPLEERRHVLAAACRSGRSRWQRRCRLRRGVGVAPRCPGPGPAPRPRSGSSCGTVVNTVSSKNASAVRTSSSGDGADARRSDVRHNSVISSRRRRRTSRSSSGVSRGRRGAEQPVTAPQRDEERAPARLGGVRGQDRRETRSARGVRRSHRRSRSRRQRVRTA